MVERFKSKFAQEHEKTHLQEILDRQCLEANEEARAERNGKPRSLYASDYGACMRKVWMQFFPEEFEQEKPDARVIRIFNNGDAVHIRLSSYLKRELDIDFRDELNVPRDELDVHGRCDGICTVRDQAVVVEFKSINKDYVSEPKEEHIGQVTWYMEMFRMLRRDLREDFGFAEDDTVVEEDLIGQVSLSGRTLESLDHVERWLLLTQGEIAGEIIYESKPTNHTFHFSVPYSEDRAKKVRTYFEALKWHVENKQMPRVNYNAGKYPCSWGYGMKAGRCPFYQYCWGEKAGEVPQKLINIGSKTT